MQKYYISDIIILIYVQFTAHKNRSLLIQNEWGCNGCQQYLGSIYHQQFKVSMDALRGNNQEPSSRQTLPNR